MEARAGNHLTTSEIGFASRPIKKMSKTKTPITRRGILMSAAPRWQLRGFPFWLLPTNPNLPALLRRNNNSEEKLT